MFLWKRSKENIREGQLKGQPVRQQSPTGGANFLPWEDSKDGPQESHPWLVSGTLI